MNKAGKGEVISNIEAKLQKAKSVILTDFHALTVEEVNKLRRELRSANAEYKVVKNTLLKRVFVESGTQELSDFFIGPTAVIFSYDDPVQTAKIVSNFASDIKKISVKAGTLDGRYIDKERVKQLSSLPSREVLLAKMVGTMKMPIVRLHRSLQTPIQKLIQVLNAIKENKQ